MMQNKKLRIGVSGIHYPLSMMSYFIEALEHREDVELFTAGPFTGDWIPWGEGLRLPQKYVHTPDFPLPQSAIQMSGKIPFSMVEKGLPFDIDLWLQVDAGWYFADRPKAKVVAHVATDPHCLNYDRQRQLADVFFNMQTPYMKPGDKYLPYAYSPRIHYPMDVEKEYDACLIGLHYPQRDQLVSRLRSRGLNVYYDLGPVFDEYRELNNKSEVGLNWSSLLDTNARVFELAAMGICAVQNRVPDMDTFFVPNEHYLPFSNVDEAEKQVLLALSDDDLRFNIGNAALHKVKGHTWDARIQQVMEICKIL